MPDELRITGKAVYEELVSRGIRVDIVDVRTGLLRFHATDGPRYVQSCLTDRSSPIGRNISDRKVLASQIAARLGLQQPAGLLNVDLESAEEFLNQYGTIVAKPNDGAHGTGVTVGITTMKQLIAAIGVASGASKTKKVLIQQQIFGSDVRVLIIGGRLAAASVRTPATVSGDGVKSLKELIEDENTSSLRGENYHKPLNFIDLNSAKEYIGPDFETIVPLHGEEIQVSGTANIGTGGTATDITDILPPQIVEQSIRIANELGQQCCGVDFLTSDIANEKQYYFLEINASPSFGLHMKPSVGKSRQVQKMFVDLLLAHT